MSINPRPCHSEPVTDVTGVGIRNLLAGNLRKSAGIMRFGNGLPRQCVPQGHLLRGAKRRGNPFPARHRRADGTSGTPSPTERFAARQTKAPAINGGGLRAGRPTRNPAAVRPLIRAGRGSEFHPARGIPKRKTILSGWCFFIFRALRSKIDEAQTRFPASHEWQSHSQEPCLYLWI